MTQFLVASVHKPEGTASICAYTRWTAATPLYTDALKTANILEQRSEVMAVAIYANDGQDASRDSSQACSAAVVDGAFERLRTRIRPHQISVAAGEPQSIHAMPWRDGTHAEMKQIGNNIEVSA